MLNIPIQKKHWTLNIERKIRMILKMKKLKVVSLFSGCGGLDLGLLEAGFHIIWANDFAKDAVATYKHNLGNHIVLEDITKIPSEQIPDDFDVLVGGFPCQGFSIANTKRNMQDSRNFLYKELLRVLKDKQPNFFIAENVKGLLSMEKGKVLEMIVKDFESLGYTVDYQLLKASEYGIPQNRERVIILGNRLGLRNTFPTKTHPNKENQITVEQAIGHLADVKTRDLSFDLNGEMIHNHVARTDVLDIFFTRKHDVNQAEICDYLKGYRASTKISTTEIDKRLGYKHTAGHWFRKDHSGSIPKPKDWWSLKDILGFDDRYDQQVTELEQRNISFEQSLRISNWTSPSDTITATNPEIHPNKERRLSVRECAILQSFPNDFVFQGSLTSMYTQVGNAVPPLLGKLLGLEILDKLKN